MSAASPVLRALAAAAVPVSRWRIFHRQPRPAELNHIRTAAPASAPARPAKPRRVLVVSRTEAFHHHSIPWGHQAVAAIGRRTGAFVAVPDQAGPREPFGPATFEGFDAVCFLNTSGEIFGGDDDAREAGVRALVEFVEAGGGFVGIHAAADTLHSCPRYARMLGGRFVSHPWLAGSRITLRPGHPDHPLTRMFEGETTTLRDEVYAFEPPGLGPDCEVLLSVDRARTADPCFVKVAAAEEFPVSWVRRAGRGGRVFYCALGHRKEVYRHPLVLAHLLAGIQFACGDLEVPGFPLAPGHAPQ